MSPFRWHVVLLFLLIVAAAFLELTPALLIGQMVDEPFEAEPNTATLAWLFAAILSMYLGSALVSLLISYVNIVMSQSLVHSIRSNLHFRLLHQPLTFFQSERTGEILSRMSTDIVVLQQVLRGSLLELMRSSVMLAIALVLMAVLEWRLALLALGVLVVSAGPVILVGSHLRQLWRDWQQNAADMNAQLEERVSVSGSLLVKTFGRQDFEAERFNLTNDQLRSLAIRRAMRARAFTVATHTTGLVALAFVFWFGTLAVTRGGTSIGTVVAFAVITQRVFGPFSALTSTGISIISSMSVFERIFEYLGLPVPVEERADAEDLDHCEGAVELERVTFTYPGGHEPALRDLSLRVEPGQFVALVGRSGAGKTTVAYLVQRLFDPDDGEVRIDGHDLKRLRLGAIARHVGFVPQEAVLFHSSLAENIRYGDLAANDAELVAAAEAAQLGELIARMPEGLDTVIGERGFRLSGGERQRVAIARALLKRPQVLILDEAVASLDALTGRAVREAWRDAERTTIVIAHQLATVESADVIFVLDQGAIVQQGTHQELMQQGGLYGEVYREQIGAVQRSPATTEG